MKQLLLFFSLLVSFHIHAILVTGIVVNKETGECIEGVSILTLNSDSVVVSQDATQADGKFRINIPKVGDYVLRFSNIGFRSTLIDVRNAQENLDFGTIELIPVTQQLDEIVVSADNYTKMDRQVIFPPIGIVERSFSALEMIHQLMLPGLIVNVGDRSISSINDRPVQLRINDIEVTIDEITALDPQKIKKVEYIDLPGMRYGNVGTVINFVLKRIEYGLSLGGNAQIALTSPYTNDQVFLKYNNRKSELGLNYRISYSKYKDSFKDEYLKLFLPNQKLVLSKEGVKEPIKSERHDLSLSYNWHNEEKTVFNVVFRNQFSVPDQVSKQNVIDELNKMNYTSLLHTKNRNYTPSIDLYFQQELGKNQTFLTNVVATYISSDYFRNYQENNQNESLYNYSYNTDGKKQTLQAEAIYENRFSQAIDFSVGLRFTQSHTENIYTMEGADVTNTMNNSDVYGYAQLQGALSKFSYQVGAGFSRIYFKEEDTHFSKWQFRPILTLAYSFKENISFRYNFFMLQFLPTLNYMSDFKQWQNPYELFVGNPNVVPAETYANNFTFNFRKGAFSFASRLFYQYTRNLINNSIYLREDQGHHYLEYHPENQKFHQHIQGYLYANWEVVRDRLNLSAFGVLNRYIDKGNNFEQSLTNTFGGFQLEGNYKDWSLSASYTIKSKMQSGETVLIFPARANISLRYRHKSIQYELSVQNLFLPDGTPQKELLNSAYVQKSTASYVRNEGNQVRLSIAWNFDLGRKYKGSQKQIYNYVDEDAGIVK